MTVSPAKPLVELQAKRPLYTWEGKDKFGKVIKGEAHAAGEAIMIATLCRQGILVTKLRKKSDTPVKSAPPSQPVTFTDKDLVRDSLTNLEVVLNYIIE